MDLRTRNIAIRIMFVGIGGIVGYSLHENRSDPPGAEHCRPAGVIAPIQAGAALPVPPFINDDIVETAPYNVPENERGRTESTRETYPL